MGDALKNQTEYISKIQKEKEPDTKLICDLALTCLPKVYRGGTDSELVIEKMQINKGDTVLDLCCGNGVIALAAKRMGASRVIGTDLNPEAIKNSNLNKKKFGMRNVKFIKGNLFANVKGKFDVITINPPYTDKKARDLTEICFWDEGNKTTKEFFEKIDKYLKNDGKAYLAWAEFADQGLLPDLAKKYDRKLKLLVSRIGRTGFRFDVYLVKIK